MKKSKFFVDEDYAISYLTDHYRRDKSEQLQYWLTRSKNIIRAWVKADVEWEGRLLDTKLSTLYGLKVFKTGRHSYDYTEK